MTEECDLAYACFKPMSLKRAAAAALGPWGVEFFPLPFTWVSPFYRVQNSVPDKPDENFDQAVGEVNALIASIVSLFPEDQWGDDWE